MKKRIVGMMVASVALSLISTHSFAAEISFENVTMTLPDEWTEDSNLIKDDGSVYIQYMGDEEGINITTAPYAEDMQSYSDLLLDAYLYGVEKTEGYVEIDSSVVDIDGKTGHMTVFFSGAQMEHSGVVVSFDTGKSIANLLYLCSTFSDNDFSKMKEIIQSIKIKEFGESGTDNTSLKNEKNYTEYHDGVYKVGADIPEGEYVVLASGGSGYFCVSTDSNQDDIVFNENFDYNSIITVHEGEYLDLTRCKAIPFEENPEVEVTGEGMFKVGVHIPAGEYKLDSGTESGYYCIYPDSRQEDIVANDNFEGQNYVTVSDGQYLLLSRCKFAEPPAKPMKTYDDAETVQKVQEALNAAGYDCGMPDGIAGSGTKSQIEKYQLDNDLAVTGTITDEVLGSLGI